MVKIKLKRGLKENLPTFDEGEPGFTTDTKEFFVGSAIGNIQFANKTDVGDIATLTTTEKGSLVGAVNEHDIEIGNITNLTTTNKTSLVAAVNEKANQSEVDVIKDSSLFVKSYSRIAPEADDLGRIQRAIDDCFTQGKKKLIFTESYVITSDTTLILKSNIEYIGVGATIDFSGRSVTATDDLTPLIHGQGTLGTAISITADALKGSQTITLTDTTGLVVGDMLFITSDFKWTGDSTDHKHGELAIIKKVTSSTQIELSSCVHEDYKLNGDTSQENTTQIALNPKVQKVTPIENVIITGFTFKGKGRSTTGERGDYGLVIRHGRNVRIHGNKFDRIDQVAMDLINVLGFEVFDNEIFHDEKDKVVVNEFIQYGIKFSNATSLGNIKDNRIWNGRHGIVSGHITDFGGIQRHVNIENNFITGTWLGAIATHNSCEFFKIQGNTLIKCENGVNIRVGHMEVINNQILRCVQGIYLSIKPEKTKIQGNRIINPDGSAIIMQALRSGWNPNDIEIVDNVCDGGGMSITIDNTTVMKRGWKISRNTIKNVSIAEGISVVGRIKGKFDYNELLSITGASRRGIKFTQVMYSTIIGNSIEGTASAPIEIQGVSDWNTICDNALFDHDFATAILNSGTGTNNKIYDNTFKASLTGDPIS